MPYPLRASPERCLRAPLGQPAGGSVCADKDRRWTVQGGTAQDSAASAPSLQRRQQRSRPRMRPRGGAGHPGPSDIKAVDRALFSQLLQDTAWQLAFRQGSPDDARHMETLVRQALTDDYMRGRDGGRSSRSVQRQRVWRSTSGCMACRPGTRAYLSYRWTVAGVSTVFVWPCRLGKELLGNWFERSLGNQATTFRAARCSTRWRRPLRSWRASRQRSAASAAGAVPAGAAGPCVGEWAVAGRGEPVA
jgi:hypothetical protein